MDHEDILLDLVARTYRAAIDPNEWTPLLKAVADATGGVDAGIHRMNKRDGRPIFFAHADMADDGRRDYADHYVNNCPRMRRAFLLRPGSVFVDYNLITERQMDRHELYADFLPRFGLRYFAGVVVLNDATEHCGFGINRSPRQGHFDGEALELVRRLAPHICQAVEMQMRFAVVADLRQSLADVLDRLPMGVILVDARARPVLMNRAAESILAAADGLASSRRGLVAAKSTLTARLRRAIGEAASTGAGAGLEAGRALALPRPSGGRALDVLVAPLPPSQERLGIGGADAVVFVTDPEHRPLAPNELLRQLYGLTPAEAELAAALAAGSSLGDFAEATGRRSETVRKTVKQVFAKTETSRQAELVAHLLKGPAGLAGRGPDRA